jgi:endoglucanase
VITTYFLYHHGVCPTGNHAQFRQEVDGLRDGIGAFPTLVFIEEDGITTLCPGNHGQMAGRARLLKYEIDQLASLPHTLLYIEGGTSDASSPSRTAWMLNHSDARRTRGFFMNDTHFNWAYREIEYGNRVSRLTGGLHFVVDTRASGQGPMRTADPVRDGNEVLCNPPRRGMGPRPGASNGSRYGMYSRYLDGFVWTGAPGTSGGSSCPDHGGSYAPAGAFDANLAIDYAYHANDRIGPTPRFRSRPYSN